MAWGGAKRALGKMSRDSPAERWPGREEEERERWTEEEDEDEDDRARDLKSENKCERVKKEKKKEVNN